MVNNLTDQALAEKKKSSALKIKKRIAALLTIDQEVLNESLRSYFTLCKAKGAKDFRQWRADQAKMKKKFANYGHAVREWRLTSYEKYNKEDELLELYLGHETFTESVMPELIRLELEIQAERAVPRIDSMNSLVSDSQAEEPPPVLTKSHEERKFRTSLAICKPASSVSQNKKEKSDTTRSN